MNAQPYLMLRATCVDGATLSLSFSCQPLYGTVFHYWVQIWATSVQFLLVVAWPSSFRTAHSRLCYGSCVQQQYAHVPYLVIQMLQHSHLTDFHVLPFSGYPRRATYAYRCCILLNMLLH